LLGGDKEIRIAVVHVLRLLSNAEPVG